MLPASPSMTLITPVGAVVFRPPGRTMTNSKSLPGPPIPRNSCSWLFLSVKMERITVLIKIRKTRGAWSALSPAPIDVTTATRRTPDAFMALITFVVPSVSMVLPTSFVLPPSATTTPVVSPVMTFATSAKEHTSPCTTVRLGSVTGVPSLAPPDPGGYTILLGVRASTVTLLPRFRACTTHSAPHPPVPPMTTMLDFSAGVAEATTETVARLGETFADRRARSA
mmetsp:Transcript_189/g.586  ORF Transcript_189/g.586 Transcript_189/m.586 type:complete len:225 (-) Transcript_189:94-768(-)